MHSTVPQPHARRTATQNWIIAAAATAVVAIGSYTGIRSGTTDTNTATPSVEPNAAPLDAGLGATFAVQSETTHVAAPMDGSGLGQALAVDWTQPPPHTADHPLEVIFGPVALEAGWAPVRYSPHAGLALLFSNMYPESVD